MLAIPAGASSSTARRSQASVVASTSSPPATTPPPTAIASSTAARERNRQWPGDTTPCSLRVGARHRRHGANATPNVNAPTVMSMGFLVLVLTSIVDTVSPLKWET
jgi:hypothetical protein